MTSRSDRLTLDPKTGTFTAFASDLGLPPGEIPSTLAVLHRGWTLAFRCAGVDRDGDEVAGFRYRPAPGLCQPQASPGVPFSVLIIND